MENNHDTEGMKSIMKTNSFVTILDQKNDIYLCKYVCGLFTVDKSNKSVGRTIFTGTESECRTFFNQHEKVATRRAER